MNAYLTDFGEYKEIDKQIMTMTNRGTEIYKAPELIKLNGQFDVRLDGEKSDIFSLGLIFL